MQPEVIEEQWKYYAPHHAMKLKLFAILTSEFVSAKMIGTHQPSLINL